jgi:ATP-binding cassette, subfamily B, bacterial MsbA
VAATPTASASLDGRPTLLGIPFPDRRWLRGLFASYRRMLVFVRPYWRKLAVAGVILTISSLLGLAIPLAIGGVVNASFVAGSVQILNWITAALIGIFVVQAILGFGQTYLISWVGERVIADLRVRLFSHLQSMPLRYFSNVRVGELISRLGNDVQTIQEAVTSTLLSLLSQVIMFVGGIVIIFVMAPGLTFLMLAVVPLAVLAMVVLGRFIRRLSKQYQDGLAETTGTAEEALAGVRTVKSFARESYEIERYGDGIQRLFEIAVQRVRVRSIIGPVIGLVAFSSIAIVLWAGSRQVIAGKLTPGQLVSFLIYTMMIASPIGAFTAIYGQFQQAMGASERVFDMLDSPPEMQDEPDALPLPPVEGFVRFEDVSFDYGDDDRSRAVLRDVSLVAEPGRVVALVGPSGAGKTTLVNLIPRFYDPTAGRITVDGYDIRHVQMRSLREQIGIVPQETALFSGSLRDNIAYGKLDASQEEIEAAARAANAHDFIQELPLGYATTVGERGVKLSGGQRQRIAIARAILKDPRILILDEATSSLDSESEQAVQEALVRLMRDRTTFVIAHRLSTITNADRIVVLEDGRVVEEGAHAELLSHDGGLYRRMYSLQFRLDEEPGAEPPVEGEGEREDLRTGGLPPSGGLSLPFVPRP